VSDLLFERVFTPIGIKPEDLVWRTNAYRPREIDGIPRREFGSGVSANVDAMARIGYLYLRRGAWRGTRILPESFIDAARAGTSFPHTADGSHYGVLAPFLEPIAEAVTSASRAPQPAPEPPAPASGSRP